MDLKTGNIGKLYLHYLFPSLFSGLVMSIYSLVDMIVVGQYEGPAGTAALACIMPLWTLFCCLSVLFGNGGAVLFSAARGAGKNYDSNLAFTVSFILISSASALVWLAILFFDQPLLKLFGADDTLMPLALQYVRWLKWGIPLWPLGYYLGMFVRNDGSPSLVGIATVCGGVFNIFGDFFLTFTCDLGMEGAAIATVAGQAIAFVIQLAHFFTKKNTVSFVRITSFARQTREILSIGFSSFICSVGMGFLMVLFNNQIMRYLGGTQLAVYGVAGNLFTLVQTFSYGIGNAAQPIVAENLGARQWNRIRQTRRWGSITAAVIGLCATAFSLLFPGEILRLFMKPSPEVMAVAPPLLRQYFICFLFVPFNVFASYYLQAVKRARASLAVSFLRSFLISGLLVYLFPLCFGTGSIWLVMVSAECIAAVISAWLLNKKIT
ncbi:MAG TPA: MATE family efflux transporter [Candidatus Egerieimonas intestinavium]|uniref:Multidrug export protein MepA n=1 Tax=Candidatus Egerieimonas intestinavium TaxID=2840777 RepID=A0A9D1EL15_9FIRM|nr:MATE family efflux transporter [Candidatus Egerieimonas intestinavium]